MKHRTNALTLAAISLSLGAAGCPGRNQPTDASAPVDALEASVAPDSAPVTDVIDTDAASEADASSGPAPCTRVGRRATEPEAMDYALRESVEVLRDDMGIPHIYGRNDEDALFGSGYAQAQDRLFQMEVLRRIAYGTSAELFGADKLSQDRIVRMVDIPRWGRESADRVRREAPETYRLMRAWVGGVNRRIREVREGTVPRPPGFRATEFDFAPERWSVEDAFSVARLLLFRNANQLEFDILASVIAKWVEDASFITLFQPMTDAFALPEEERPRVGPRMFERAREQDPRGGARPEAPSRPWWQREGMPSAAALRARFAEFTRTMDSVRSGGSNNWAIAGRFTENGRPIIAGDPHQSLTSPAVFWAHHVNSLDAGGTLDVAGFGFAGTPGVQLGHNRRVAWTATTTYPDFMDLFEVRANREAGTISLAGATHRVERCVERIAVRGAAAEEYVVEDVPGQGVLIPTNLAPLPITQSSANRVLFRWVGFRATIEADVFLAMDRAQSVADFEAQVDRMETGAFNWVSADATAISYRVHVSLPDRGNPAELPFTPNRVLPGANPRVVWAMDRFAPVTQFPHSRGGARGFLASANNDPLGFTQNGRTDDDPWYYGVWFDPGTRARRIETVLAQYTERAATTMGGARVTAREMMDLQMDVRSVLADELVPVLEEALDRVATDPALAEFRNDAGLVALGAVVRGWDRRMARDSSGAVAYEGWQGFFAHRALADDLGPVFDAVYGAESVYVLKMLVNALKGRHAMADRLFQEGRHRLALLALRDAQQWLTQRFGGAEPSRYRWRDLHRTEFRALFSPPGVFDGGERETDGSVGTVNVSQAPFLAPGARAARMRHTSGSGAVYRMVATFAADATPEAQLNFVRGNSGDPTSRRWGDQVDNWVDGVYRPLAFRRADVVARSAAPEGERLVLSP